VLNPQIPSNWGSLRKQPRPECLSTIESLSFTLHHLKETSKVSEALEDIFQKHVESMSSGVK
jgi:DTW domain-containing protein YfiP